MKKVSKWIVLVVYIATLALNFLSAQGLIGASQKEVSDSLPNLFVPAPFTFAIWLVIYVMTFVFIGYQIFSKDYDSVNWIEEKINPLFVLMCLFNAAWVVSFSQRWIAVSTVLIIGFLVVVYRIMDRIQAWPVNSTARLLTVKLPFGLYAGWLLAAVTANITAFLVDIKWNRFGIAEEIWLYIVLVVVILLVSLFAFKYRCGAIPAVGIWTFFGILRQHQTTFGGRYPIAIVILYIGMVVFLVDLVFQAGKLLKKE